jgi:hypothetical protein
MPFFTSAPSEDVRFADILAPSLAVTVRLVGSRECLAELENWCLTLIR